MKNCRDCIHIVVCKNIPIIADSDLECSLINSGFRENSLHKWLVFNIAEKCDDYLENDKQCCIAVKRINSSFSCYLTSNCPVCGGFIKS